jgi:hypothetical protein
MRTGMVCLELGAGGWRTSGFYLVGELATSICPWALKQNTANVGFFVFFLRFLSDVFDKYVFGVFESPCRETSKNAITNNGKKRHGIFLIFFAKHFRHGFFFI